ncbi:GyrI-like domain-containing protein [Butyrivibrio fibrisolvens]|uniref:GyrI-like domain-containing protein n=1 Tax=Butyrivibrio fibrisolvens TaxID=831 RepID=UPI0024182AC5|nr:GyrI-like domain-containing protein [Butyrivibrio fibrisolvens]
MRNLQYSSRYKQDKTKQSKTGQLIRDMWERIYKEWLPVSDYELIPDVDIENYLPGDPLSSDYVSEICIPVRKKQ